MRLIRLLKTDLCRETVEWVDDGLISRDQALRICERYGVDYTQLQDYSAGYRVLINLGFLFVGLAILTLLGANWEQIPPHLRTLGLVLLTLVTQLDALRRFASGGVDNALGMLFLANIFFGASLLLIAQIYPMGDYLSDLLFLWALGCLPSALSLNNPWLALQSLALALAWFLLEAARGAVPPSFLLFPAASAWILWRGQTSSTLFMLLLSATVIWLQCALAFRWREGPLLNFQVEHALLAVALLVPGFVLGHGLAARPSSAARDYGALMASWILRLAVVVLLVMSFDEPWRALLRAPWEHWRDLALLTGGGALVLLPIAYRVGQLPVTLFCVLLLAGVGMAVVGLRDPAWAVVFQVADNLLLVLFSGALIVRGMQRGISHYFFIGVLALLIMAFLRYIDLIGDYLGAALLFLVFAGLLFGAALYWRHAQHQGE